MFAGRSRRRPIAVFLMLALLLMQWAVASYACPQRAAAAAMPCEGHAVSRMDPDSGVLCKTHCTAGAQQAPVDAPQAPAVALVGPVLAGVLDVAGAEGIAAAMPASVALGPPEGAPPLCLALQVLRN